MKKFINLILAILLSLGWSAYADTYVVTASTILNIRKSPSKKSKIIGTLSPNQEVDVVEIKDNWAKITCKKGYGYIYASYIASKTANNPIAEEGPMEKDNPVENVDIVSDENIHQHYNTDQNSEYEPEIRKYTNTDLDVNTPLIFGSSLSDNLNIYLGIQGGFGFSTFQWDGGDVNEKMSYSGDIIAQMYFENKTSFIPRNWYCEADLGFDSKGASDFDMNYIHFRAYPFGYRVRVSPINVVFKAGANVAYPINQFYDEYDSDFQVGIIGGFQIEWEQFAIGCNVEYDFTEVSASCNQTLNNLAVLGTISYKFAKFGHRR